MAKKNVKTKKSSILWLGGVTILAISLLIFCQFYFGYTIDKSNTYLNGTHINGIDVSGKTQAEASRLISEKVIADKNNINITLKSDDKEWMITGDDLDVVNDFSALLASANINGQNNKILNQDTLKCDSLYINIPPQEVYCGIDRKLDAIISDIETQPTMQHIVFSPDEENMFSINNLSMPKAVDKLQLKSKIYQALSGEIKPIIDIPTQSISPSTDLQDFVNSISLRGKFSTNLAKSTADRKSNIKLALSKFNGMIIEPNQTVSFNNTTGPRTAENGYKNAKIIIDGKYVPGVGGGVCQASTTLYNALLLSDIEVLQVFHHTLPASYVPLSFDAMVSDGYADLVFQNSLDTPIFIKTHTTDTLATVEIYGKPLEDGLTISTRTELVKIIPHNGDEIIADVNGQYEDKVLYKGEYYRLKSPIEGYESKGYVQYLRDGVLIEEKQIRSDRYMPQNGIIVEGIYSLEEGMSLPGNQVKYIPPQKITQA